LSAELTRPSLRTNYRIPVAHLEAQVEVHLRSLETQQGKLILSLIRDFANRDPAVGFRLHLAALVNTSGEAIIGKTLGGIITSWNRSAERIFGYSVEEAVGRHISMLFPAGKDAEAADVLERLKRGETVSAHDAVRRPKDGHNIDVSMRISPIFDPLGNLVGASKVARDVTELKQMKNGVGNSQGPGGFVGSPIRTRNDGGKHRPRNQQSPRGHPRHCERFIRDG
jgi:PAS domain S-box-containing protein